MAENAKYDNDRQPFVDQKELKKTKNTKVIYATFGLFNGTKTTKLIANHCSALLTALAELYLFFLRLHSTDGDSSMQVCYAASDG